MNSDIAEFREILCKYRTRLKEINEKTADHDVEGHHYILKHIKEIGKINILLLNPDPFVVIKT